MLSMTVFRGRVFGVMMTLGITFGALSPYITGLIHDMVGGYKVAYLILGISLIISGAMVLTIPSKRPHA